MGPIRDPVERIRVGKGSGIHVQHRAAAGRWLTVLLAGSALTFLADLPLGPAAGWAADPARPAPAKPASPKPAAPRSAAQAAAAASAPVRINPDLDVCEVTGDFDIGGTPPRRAKTLVYNPRNDLVYTGFGEAPEGSTRIVEGVPRQQAIQLCNDYAAKNRGSAAAQAYQRSLDRAQAIMQAEQARAAGKSVPSGQAVLPPRAVSPGLPPSAPRSDTGPSASAARAAAAAPAPAATGAGPMETGRTGTPEAVEKALRTQLLDILLPGIVLPTTLTAEAERQVDERVVRGIEEALVRSPDVDSARRSLTAANHQYQAAVRDKLNPDFVFETQGGMSHGRRGPAVQSSDDVDPVSGGATTTSDFGVRGFVRPGFALSMPVYDAGEREAKKNIAGIDADTTTLSLDDTRAETAAIVRQLYYEWRVSRAYIGLIQQWRPLFDEWFGKIAKLERAQMVTFQDVMLSRAVDEHFRERMDAICADLALREKIWEHTVGLPSLRLPSDKAAAWCDRPKGTKTMPAGAQVQALDDVTMSHWPVLPAYPSDQQLDVMVDRAPALLAAQNEVKKRREKVAIAESQSLPRLFAEAHARRTVPGFENTIGDSDNFVGMRFVMPIFDNFVRSSRTQAEQAGVGAAETKVIATREKMRRDARLLTAELARLGNLQVSQFETVRAAAIRLKNAKYRFEELGSKEQKELMLANLDYLRTFERSDDTIRQYFTVFNRLLRALGVAGADWNATDG